MDSSPSPRLTGNHAELYRESLGVMLDVFRERLFDEDGDSQWRFCVALFDDLQWQQQIGYLTRVSKCVLEGTGDPQDWSAIEKATFYAVYHHIYQQLQMERDMSSLDLQAIEASFADQDFDLDDDEEELAELDDGDDLSWKEMIASAYREKCLADGMTTDEIESRLVNEADADTDEDLGHWHSLLESLADQNLDDRDFEMASTLMDADPSTASKIKKYLGIKPEYFVEPADDPTDAMVPHLFRELSQLAGISPLEDSEDDSF